MVGVKASIEVSRAVSLPLAVVYKGLFVIMQKAYFISAYI